MYKLKLIFFSIISFVLIGQLTAQDGWGVGVNAGYVLPLGGLRDWYSGTPQFGGNVIFNTSQNSDIQVEYNYCKLSPGSIENRKFSYKSMLKHPDENGDMKKLDSLYSSYGSSYMTVNSITINLDKYFSRMNFLNSRFLISGGVGFYIQYHHVDSLLYGGRPIYKHKMLFLKPYEDKRVALGFNLGGGIEFMLNENNVIDLRARYNLFISELRPLEAYRYEGEGFTKDGEDVGPLKQVFPVQYLNFNITYKFFFK